MALHCLLIDVIQAILEGLSCTNSHFIIIMMLEGLKEGQFSRSEVKEDVTVKLINIVV